MLFFFLFSRCASCTVLALIYTGKQKIAGSYSLSSFHFRYTFGKPVTGRLIVNMTINGVGYYRHEVGHPVLKTTQVRETIESAAIKCLICTL